jgi:hypothetical protein
MSTTKKIKKGGNNKKQTKKGGIRLPYTNSFPDDRKKEEDKLNNISGISELNDELNNRWGKLNNELNNHRNEIDRSENYKANNRRNELNWHLPEAPQVKSKSKPKFPKPPERKPPIPDIKAANTTPDAIPPDTEYSFVETMTNPNKTTETTVFVYKVNEAKKITEIAEVLNKKKGKVFKKYSVKKDETEKIVPKLEAQVYRLSEDGLLIEELNQDENSADNNNDGSVYSFVISTKNDDETVSVLIRKLVVDESDKINEIVKNNIKDEETFLKDFKGYSILKDENGKTVFKNINGGKKRKTFKRKTKILKRKTFKKHKRHNRTTK